MSAQSCYSHKAIESSALCKLPNLLNVSCAKILYVIHRRLPPIQSQRVIEPCHFIMQLPPHLGFIISASLLMAHTASLSILAGQREALENLEPEGGGRGGGGWEWQDVLVLRKSHSHTHNLQTFGTQQSWRQIA